MAGYHRIGIDGGLDVSYRLSDQWRAHVRLLYRNTGSRNSPFSDIKRSINLHMAQIPVYASYLTWWDNGLARVHFDIGMAYGRIVHTSVQFPEWEDRLTSFRQNDVSLFGGMGFWFTYHHGLRMAYHRSLSTLMKNPAEDFSWHLYFMSLQYQFRF